MFGAAAKMVWFYGRRDVTRNVDVLKILVQLQIEASIKRLSRAQNIDRDSVAAIQRALRVLSC